MRGGTGDTRHNIAYPASMTTLEITLPDDLARDAAKAGFLAPERLAETLRAQINAQAKLDALLLEGLEGEETEWTEADGESLRKRASGQ